MWRLDGEVPPSEADMPPGPTTNSTMRTVPASKEDGYSWEVPARCKKSSDRAIARALATSKHIYRYHTWYRTGTWYRYHTWYRIPWYKSRFGVACLACVALRCPALPCVHFVLSGRDELIVQALVRTGTGNRCTGTNPYIHLAPIRPLGTLRTTAAHSSLIYG